MDSELQSRRSPLPMPVTTSGTPLFLPGDRVCWIGDSITHNGLWHAYLTLFHQTRFPGVTCSWINCGLSGDSAAGALRRFAWDIAPHRPTVAVLMLGMNDVQRHLYGDIPMDAALLAQRQQAIDHHVRDMTDLALELTAIGCQLIVLSPTIYDDTGVQHTANLRGVDRALALCGEHARALAARFNGRFIDLHTPMAACNAALQRTDPTATIIGGDRVHPGPPGHLFMAHQVLRALGATPTIAAVSVRADDGSVVAQDNCAVSVQDFSQDGVVFRYEPFALPFPLPEAAHSAGAWAPIADDLGRETLQVIGLRPGRYVIEMDGEVVTVAAATDLAAGIDLAHNPATPHYRQAQEVARHNLERHRLISEELRVIAAIRHFHLDPNGIDHTDIAAVECYARARLAKTLAENNAYGFRQFGTFLRVHQHEATIKDAVMESVQAMHHATNIRPLRVSIVSLDPAAR